MKKLLFILIMLSGIGDVFGQIATDGDYRTASSGNWTTPATWEVRNGGVWSPALVEPTANNNVYLQTGHSVIIDNSNVYCKDLHFGYKGSVYGSVQLGVNKLNVNGKVRVYAITNSPVTGIDDGLFYTDQTSSTATNASMFVSSNTSGVLKFVGESRTITNVGEWNSNGTVCYGEFALNANAIGTLEVGMKFRGLTISSGKVINLDRFAIGSTSGSGDFVLKNGATVQFERNGLASLMASNFSNPINPSGKLEIEEGGTLIFKSAMPAFNFSTYINNGTVVYSGQLQTLLKTGVSTNPAASLNSYHKLEISAIDGVEIPANSNITISDQLTLTSGKLVIPETSTLELITGNTEVIGGNTSNYIQTLTNGGTSGILKVTGLSSSKTFPIGTSSKYTPVTLSPTVTSNFTLHVFEGITEDATPNGTSVDATTKTNLVNAVWNINRVAGSGDCTVTLGWQNDLEGVNFTSLTNAEIGISVFKNGSYSAYAGSGDNIQNTATAVLSEFGPLSVGKIGALPVQLISFDLHTKGNKVNINWSTASEQNSAVFIVERSADGKNFEAIATVNAAGNTNEKQFYSYEDNKPIAGTGYYRLVQYDKDGKYKLYDIKAVEFDFLNKDFIIINTAEPSGLSFKLNSDIASRAEAVLSGIQGNKILSQTINIEAGEHIYNLNNLSLAPGVYAFFLKYGNKVYTAKIIK